MLTDPTNPGLHCAVHTASAWPGLQADGHGWALGGAGKLALEQAAGNRHKATQAAAEVHDREAGDGRHVCTCRGAAVLGRAEAANTFVPLPQQLPFNNLLGPGAAQPNSLPA